MSVVDSVLALLAPHECLSCGEEGQLLCNLCISALPAAPQFEHLLVNLSSVRAVTVYNGAAKDLIWQLKSAGAQAAAKIMASEMSKHINPKASLIIVPVPTASRRVRHRGYDQAKLLARAVSRQTKLPYLNCLTRIGQTHQVGASRQQRLNQLQNAFRVRHPELIKNAHLLLIDDVITTGATTELAAQTLLKAGAGSVSALTFAQA